MKLQTHVSLRPLTAAEAKPLVPALQALRQGHALASIAAPFSPPPALAGIWDTLSVIKAVGESMTPLGFAKAALGASGATASVLPKDDALREFLVECLGQLNLLPASAPNPFDSGVPVLGALDTLRDVVGPCTKAEKGALICRLLESASDEAHEVTKSKVAKVASIVFWLGSVAFKLRAEHATVDGSEG